MKISEQQKKGLMVAGGVVGVGAVIYFLVKGKTVDSNTPIFLPASGGNFDPFAADLTPTSVVDSPAPTGGVDPPIPLSPLIPTTPVDTPIIPPSITTPLNPSRLDDFFGVNLGGDGNPHHFSLAQSLTLAGVDSAFLSDFQNWSGVSSLSSILGRPSTIDDARRVAQAAAQIRAFGRVNALTGGDVIPGEAVAIRHYAPNLDNYVRSEIAISGTPENAATNLIKAGVLVEDVAQATGISANDVVSHITAQQLPSLSGAQIVSAGRVATAAQLAAAIPNLSIAQLQQAAGHLSAQEIATAIPFLSPQQRAALHV